MDLSVLTPSAETVSAFFGSFEPSALALFDAQSGERVAVANLTPGANYTARLEGETVDWVPIKQIATRLGEDVEARVQRLSTAFYKRVFADNEQRAFRQLFVSHAGTVEAAADAQWRWLCEMWGGEKRYTEQFGRGSLLTRMLAKHGASRMSYRFCERWLVHMMAAMEEVGLIDDDDLPLAQSIRRYWLHFFGFFELSVEERRRLKSIALL